MRIGIYSAAITLLCLGSISAPCQLASGGHFATFKELLRERGVELSETSLVAALKNPDSHVRYLAALVLAEDKASDAMPAIADALYAEKVPETRANIALALAQLGDEKGFVTLESTCAKSETAAYLRLYAAKYLLDLHRGSCLTPAIAIIQSNADIGSRVLALSLLPRFQKVLPGDSLNISDVSVKALNDTQPEMRRAAGDTLRQLGDVAAIPDLQRVIASEKDEGVRSRLQSDLQSLELKERH